MNTSSGIGVSTESNDTMNEDTPIVVASIVKEGVTTSVVDKMVEKEKISSLEDTTLSESFPSFTTPVTTTVGNAPGKSSYANVTSKPSRKKVNVRTLFTPEGNGIDVVVPVDSIHAISERLANTAYGFFLGKKVAYPVVANYVRNTWGKYGLVRSMFSSSAGLFSFQFSSMDGLDAMLENGPWFIRNNPLILKKWYPDENLLKEDVSTVPGRSIYARVMIEPRADECPKNTGAGEKKTVKMPSQTSRGVLVGPKMGFKPQKEYRPVPKKPNASSSGNKKKCVEPTIEVSNSYLFDVLNSVDSDVKFGTNGGTTNLVNNGATSSGSSFMNIDNDEEFASNTPIGEKIDKIERQICEGKLRLLDNDGNPLVPAGIVESDSEVEVVFDETAYLRISTSDKDGSDKGYGTNSLL
ncbi:retrovirus-related pol polyprotein from transposon TNT 1-94 [Tanacetum coccineum]